MIYKNFHTVLAMLLLSSIQFGSALADFHTTEALHHATEAAKSEGDSKAVGEHASEALKHIEAVKATNPDMAKKLEKGEFDLNSAVEHANRFNTDSATKDAKDAKSHLEAVHQ